MTVRPTQLMSNVLELLARTRTMVPGEDDRRTLAEAALILADRERLVTVNGEPRVLIVTGEGYDPALSAIDDLEQDMEAARDTLATFDDKLDDLRRLLRKSPPVLTEGPTLNVRAGAKIGPGSGRVQVFDGHGRLLGWATVTIDDLDFAEPER